MGYTQYTMQLMIVSAVEHIITIFACLVCLPWTMDTPRGCWGWLSRIRLLGLGDNELVMASGGDEK